MTWLLSPWYYLLENISWYAPIYNLAWVLFMVYALTLPVLFVAIFHLPLLRTMLPPQSWRTHRRTFGYLLAAALAVFAFRLIPYWIFTDKILHFLGGGIAIAFVYEYFVVNFKVVDGQGLIRLPSVRAGKALHLLSNLFLLLLFSCFFCIFSELYEFVSKYYAGFQFDSDGLDTWLDMLYNIGGAMTGYVLLWLVKYARQR